MRVGVVGFGRSGQAAYRLLKDKGFDVYAFDDRAELKGANLFGKGKINKFFEISFDEVVLSPGVKPSHPFVKHCRSNRIKLISELELGYRYAKGKIIAITGTNGKSTTVALVERILKGASKRVIACGNYGLPLSEAIYENAEYYVVEASSYQLEFIDKFKPNIAAILNIAFDHLSWHGSMDNYIEAKKKIFKNQLEDDFFIKNDSDSYIFDGKANLFLVSKRDRNADCFFEKNGVIVNRPEYLRIDKTGLFGSKVFENIAFAALIGLLCGIEKKTIKEVVGTMSNLEHRIEFVDEIDGVKFYNDSKATNLDAVEAAINSFDEGIKIVIILGGKHKGESYSRLLPLLEKRARAVVVYGEDRKVILNELDGFLPVPLPAVNIWGAVRAAFEVASKDDVVLFSPGGSSCEPYKNFEERGEAFKKEVEVFKKEYEQAPLV
ncbi:UDP-N-acetylmuramoyl-L-alanine--D-glutamate ligase [Hippea maritima]|uniref:UDP-N-acetylmuramoylalanine--D-glutamate ligase n=1 Tax=Hippea maritima (strain ATCC 700847 / DSM 10411 / MH2) TaxID=760142 RepID=F2LTV1_HIPMA|nr:UDP-N-acetylmuramoyl-L-alanine--D-glutamate ligase [Hippea maritima]AEA34477.1 UDP-N-acetylmuramoylalanine--D-glutamate ligase [Hippea maritima DSM 10411]